MRGNKKVVLFTDNDPDSVVERPLYEAAFKADGLDVVGDYTFPVGTTNFSSFTAAAKATGAQLLAGQMAPAGLRRHLRGPHSRPGLSRLLSRRSGG